MAVTAKEVNALRKKTGAGMMDCKKALVEADGDMDKAIDLLRKKGAAVAAKRADRAANEGVVATSVSEDGKFGAMVEINCETDFVAKSDDFVAFADEILNEVVAAKAKDVDELFAKNPKLKDRLEEVTGKVGEKTEINRVASVEAPNGVVVDYIHLGSKLGVLVMIDGAPADKKNAYQSAGKDIAMQIAAMSPIAVDRGGVPKDVVEKEMEVYREMAVKEGKPEKIVDKIAQGRLNKFYEENCLLEQAYIKDNAVSVREFLEGFNKEHGAEATITDFLRFQLGENEE